MRIMTAAENPGFSPFSKGGLNLVEKNASHFHTKSWKDSDHCEEDLADLYEKIDMTDLSYEEVIKADFTWEPPNNDISKRASRHLSGGSVLEHNGRMCVTSGTVSNFSGGVMCAPQDPRPSSEEPNRTSKNPFRNIKMLVDESDYEEVKGCFFPATNPFSVFNDSSLRNKKRTPSQCSTRAVSPSEDSNPFVSKASSFFFSIPMTSMVNQGTQTVIEPLWLYNEKQCFQTTMNALRISGWYYENVSWQDSVLLLKNHPPGTFLLRDSADPSTLFSLSIQTSRGPTSVRIHYVDGRFRLDAEEKLKPRMPSFESVIELIEFYRANSLERLRRRLKSKKKISVTSQEQVWIDLHGQIFSSIFLSEPLRKRDKITSLQHLSRLTVSRLIRSSYRSTISSNRNLITNPSVPISYLIDTLSIPQTISDYLKEYPYSQ